MFFLKESKCSNWEKIALWWIDFTLSFFRKRKAWQRKNAGGEGSDSLSPLTPTPKRLRDLASL